jgi:hypothetical protein
VGVAVGFGAPSGLAAEPRPGTGDAAGDAGDADAGAGADAAALAITGAGAGEAGADAADAGAVVGVSCGSEAESAPLEYVPRAGFWSRSSSSVLLLYIRRLAAPSIAAFPLPLPEPAANDEAGWAGRAPGADVAVDVDGLFSFAGSPPTAAAPDDDPLAPDLIAGASAPPVACTRRRASAAAASPSPSLKLWVVDPKLTSAIAIVKAVMFRPIRMGGCASILA